MTEILPKRDRIKFEKNDISHSKVSRSHSSSQKSLQIFRVTPKKTLKKFQEAPQKISKMTLKNPKETLENPKKTLKKTLIRLK